MTVQTLERLREFLDDSLNGLEVQIFIAFVGLAVGAEFGVAGNLASLVSDTPVRPLGDLPEL